jgi:hypothetical protein
MVFPRARRRGAYPRLAFPRRLRPLVRPLIPAILAIMNPLHPA